MRGLGHQSVAYRTSSLTHDASRRNGLQPGEKAPDITVVGSAGDVLRLHEVLRRRRHVLVVPSSAKPPTLFARFGNLLPLLFALLLAATAIAVRRRRR